MTKIDIAPLLGVNGLSLMLRCPFTLRWCGTVRVPSQADFFLSLPELLLLLLGQVLCCQINDFLLSRGESFSFIQETITMSVSMLNFSPAHIFWIIWSLSILSRSVLFNFSGAITTTLVVFLIRMALASLHGQHSSWGLSKAAKASPFAGKGVSRPWHHCTTVHCQWPRWKRQYPRIEEEPHSTGCLHPEIRRCHVWTGEAMQALQLSSSCTLVTSYVSKFKPCKKDALSSRICS